MFAHLAALGLAELLQCGEVRPRAIDKAVVRVKAPAAMVNQGGVLGARTANGNTALSAVEVIAQALPCTVAPKHVALDMVLPFRLRPLGRPIVGVLGDALMRSLMARRQSLPEVLNF